MAKIEDSQGNESQAIDNPDLHHIEETSSIYRQEHQTQREQRRQQTANRVSVG